MQKTNHDALPLDADIDLDQSLVDESWRAIRGFLPPSVIRSGEGKENFEPTPEEGTSPQDATRSPAFAKSLNDVRNAAVESGEVADKAWKTIQENAVRVHEARGMNVNVGKKRTVNRFSAAMLKSINMNLTAIARTPDDVNDGTSETTARRPAIHLRSAAKRLPLPRQQKDHLILERRRHLVESWIEAQRERVAKQEELQGLLRRSPGLSVGDAGKSGSDGAPRGEDERPTDAQGVTVDRGSDSTGNIIDQTIDPSLPLALPLIPSPTPSRHSATSEPTVSAPPSATTVRRNRRKRGLTPGQRARMAEGMADAEEEVDATEAVAEVKKGERDAIPTAEGAGETREYGSVESTAENEREVLSRTMLDLIAKGTIAKAEPAWDTASTDLPQTDSGVTALSAITQLNAQNGWTGSWNALALIPSFSTEHTLAANASEALLKVDMHSRYLPATIHHAPLNQAILSVNQDRVTASDTGENADLTLSPLENNLFRHSRRWSNPIIFSPPIRPAPLNTGYGSTVVSPPKDDIMVVSSATPMSLLSSSSESDDTEEAYLSAEGELTDEEGDRTTKHELAVTDQQISPQSPKEEAVQDQSRSLDGWIAHTGIAEDSELQDIPSTLQQPCPAAKVSQEAKCEDCGNVISHTTAEANANASPSASPKIFDVEGEHYLLDILARLSTDTVELTAQACLEYLQSLADTSRMLALHHLLEYLFRTIFKAPSNALLYASLLSELNDLIGDESEPSSLQDHPVVPLFTTSLPHCLISTAEMALLEMFESDSREMAEERPSKIAILLNLIRQLGNRKLMMVTIDTKPVEDTVKNPIQSSDIGPLCCFVIICHLSEPEATTNLRRVIEKAVAKLQELSKDGSLPETNKHMVTETLRLVADDRDAAQTAVEDPHRTDPTAIAGVPDHDANVVQAAAMTVASQDEAAEAICLGPAAEKGLLSRFNRLSTDNPWDTAWNVFLYLETFPPRYQSYALAYLVRQMFASFLGSNDMIPSYALFSRGLQNLCTEVETLEGLPTAIFKESREALIALCELDVNSTDATNPDRTHDRYAAWHEFLRALHRHHLIDATLAADSLAEIMEKQGPLKDQEIRSLCHLLLFLRVDPAARTKEVNKLMKRGENWLQHIRWLRNPSPVWSRMISLVLGDKDTERKIGKQ